MYILGIDTTSEQFSISLLDLDSKEVIGYKKVETKREQLKLLIPEIDDMLKSLNVSLKEIKYVAPSIGPGSFTGIRIGVASARAICQSLGILGIPVPTLNSFLMKESVKEKINDGYLVSGIINARREQVYGFIYAKDGFILEPGPYMIQDILGKVDGKKVIFYGDGVDSYKDYIKDYEVSDIDDRYQNARDAVLLSLDIKPVNYDELLPLYMRLAEAEQKLRNGELKISHMRQE